MRKDLRIGLGIGGVLLAVLVVAIIVRSHGKDKPKLAKATETGQTDPIDGIGGEPTPPGADGTGTGTGQPNSTPGALSGAGANSNKDPFDPESPTGTSRTGATANGSATSGTPTSAAGGSPDDWEKILNASSPGPIRSMTPAQSGTTGGRSAKGRGDKSTPPGLIATDRPAGNDRTSGANGTEPVTVSGTTGGSGHASAAGTPRTHVIKTGETFTSIARSVYGDGRYYLQIQKANPGVEPSTLKPGTKINLPDLSQASGGESRTTGGRASRTARGGESSGSGSIDPKTQYKVEQNDSLYKIAEKLYGDGTRMDALYEANKQAIGPDPRKLKLGMILRLPEQPTVTSAGR